MNDKQMFHFSRVVAKILALKVYVLFNILFILLFTISL